MKKKIILRLIFMENFSTLKMLLKGGALVFMFLGFTSATHPQHLNQINSQLKANEVSNLDYSDMCDWWIEVYLCSDWLNDVRHVC